MDDRKIESLLRDNACAILAAAIVTAAGRPVSVQEATEIQRDVFMARYGDELKGFDAYEAWAKVKDERLARKFE